MFKNIIIVAKNKLWKLIQRSKSNSSNTRWAAFDLFYHLSDLTFSIFKFSNLGQSILASRNHSAIRRLLFFITNLVVSFKSWHAWTLGDLISHSTIHQVLKVILRLAHLHFFSFFCFFCMLVSLLCSSIHIPENQEIIISYCHKINIWGH